MPRDKIVHVIPVGFEEDRAVYGLMELGATDIYLLVDNKPGSWGEEARRHTERVEDRLKNVFLDASHLRRVAFDPTRYDSCQEVVSKILSAERDAKKVFLNVSTSTKLCAIAFAIKAMEFENVFLYYVVPQSYNLPTQGRPFSIGAQRIEVFSPRTYKFAELDNLILKSLDENSFSSLGELNFAILPDDVSKASRAKLSYYVRKLQQQGYVDFEPGRKLSLTPLGRTRMHPPVDDAGISRKLEK